MASEKTPDTTPETVEFAEPKDTAPAREKRKIRLPKIRRDRKLLVHVGLIVSFIFLIVIGVTALILIKGNIRTYLESKEEYMRPLADRQQLKLDATTKLGWFIDYWENNPDIEQMYIERDEKDPNYQALKAKFSFDEDTNLPIYEDADLEKLEISWGTMILFMGDLLREDVNLSEFTTMLGEDYSYLLNDLEGVKKVIATGRPMFQRYDSPKNGNYYYVYISPVLDQDGVRAVQLLVYDWSDFHSNVIKKVLWIVGISALVLALSAVLLLYFINRSAIRPLGKVQKGVREYMETKDSLKVYDHLKDIKQRNEIGALADDVTQMAVEIDRYTEEVTTLTKDRERVAAELSLAADIQKGFLPGDFPDAPDYELYASMNPAKEVGGDLYDFFDIDPAHVGLVIGDVSGKGVPASLFMMIAKVLIREYARTGLSPAEVLTRANQTLCSNNKNDMFVTAWFGILDRTNGKIVAASAGHEFPILRKEGEEFSLIKDRHGFVLGGMEMSKYREYELELGKGGILFVYTDGAAEATNAEQQLFGTDRMLEALNTHPCGHPREVIDVMDRAISDFVGSAPQFDDLTMLCVRYIGQSTDMDGGQ